jgi:hypothetical protein
MADYMQELDEKLQAARKRLKQGNEVAALKQAAPTFFEIIDEEISLAVNRMNQDKPLPHDDYLSAHGEVKMGKRIRDLLNSKEVQAPQAQAEVQGIEANIKQIKDDQKLQ